jgi:hypothetical protein
VRTEAVRIDQLGQCSGRRHDRPGCQQDCATSTPTPRRRAGRRWRPRRLVMLTDVEGLYPLAERH